MIKLGATALVIGTLILAGCSTSSTTPAATATPTESPTVVGGSPGTWTPVQIDSNKPESVVVGQALIVVTEGVTKVETSDSSVLTVSQPRTESSGSATFDAGAQAVGVGSATLTVYEGDRTLYDTPITVAEYKPTS